MDKNFWFTFEEAQLPKKKKKPKTYMKWKSKILCEYNFGETTLFITDQIMSKMSIWEQSSDQIYKSFNYLENKEKYDS